MASNQKTVIVTGASQGIGAGVVQSFDEVPSLFGYASILQLMETSFDQPKVADLDSGCPSGLRYAVFGISSAMQRAGTGKKGNEVTAQISLHGASERTVLQASLFLDKEIVIGEALSLIGQYSSPVLSEPNPFASIG